MTLQEAAAKWFDGPKNPILGCHSPMDELDAALEAALIEASHVHPQEFIESFDADMDIDSPLIIAAVSDGSTLQINVTTGEVTVLTGAQQ